MENKSIELCIEFACDESGRRFPIFRYFVGGQLVERGGLAGTDLVLADALIARMLARNQNNAGVN